MRVKCWQSISLCCDKSLKVWENVFLNESEIQQSTYPSVLPRNFILYIDIAVSLKVLANFGQN